MSRPLTAWRQCPVRFGIPSHRRSPWSVGAVIVRPVATSLLMVVLCSPDCGFGHLAVSALPSDYRIHVVRSSRRRPEVAATESHSERGRRHIPGLSQNVISHGASVSPAVRPSATRHRRTGGAGRNHAAGTFLPPDGRITDFRRSIPLMPI